jgi:hypothetical protein
VIQMGKKAVVFGIAGVFIMLSFLSLLIATELFVASIFYLPQMLLVLISAGIGFYLLGYGLEIE